MTTLSLLAAIRSGGLALLMLTLAFAAVPGRVAAHGADMHDLKSAFIYNFLKFTEWPAGALGAEGQPLIIGVLDEPDLAAALRHLLSTKRVDDRPIAVRRIDAHADIRGCHVLFVGTRGSAGVAAALSHARGSPMLTLGNGAGFLDAGGMLAFDERGGKLAFLANPGPANHSRLTLSSQLLRIATSRSTTPR